MPLSTHGIPAKQRDASRPKLLKLECWKCHIWGEEDGGGTTAPPLPFYHPLPPWTHHSFLLIKKHTNHPPLYSHSVSQLLASYSNPRLLPARNLTVRNLSARRLKPEECYCSGHSCTSAGRGYCCRCVCEWRGWRKEGRVGGWVEGVKKATLCVSSALRLHDKEAHSWQWVDTFLRPGWLPGSFHPLALSIFLQHHTSPVCFYIR